MLLAAITALAAFFRLYQLAELPPGFQFDQAFYVFDALRLLQGEFALFFPQPGKSEPLYQYLLMVGVALCGSDTPLGLKLTGAIIGTLTIPLVYGVTRALFVASPARSRVALLAALFTAISFWHIFYCRYGERIVLTLFFAILAFWFFWRALIASPQFQVSGSRFTFDFILWRDYVLTGLFTGLTLYTYPSGRIVPVALVLLTAYAALTDRTRATYYLKGLVLAGIVTTIIFLPLGTYYLLHPADFLAHAADVSIFVPHGAVSNNVPLELGRNALKILEMFFVVGDGGVLRNLPYRPIFDPLVAALFLTGALAWFAAFNASPAARQRAMFLLVWLGLALALSLVSDDAPNNGRVLVGLPVVMMLPAWGAIEIGERVRAPMARHAGGAALALVVLVSAGLTYRDYFVTLANDPATYLAFDADKVEIAQWINATAPTQHLYLAPVVHQVGTISLLTRLAPLKSFESRDTVILPSRAEGKDAVFAFPLEQEKKAQTMLTRLGALATRDELPGVKFSRLLWLVRVPAQNLPDPQDPLATLARGGEFIQPQKNTRAIWGDAIELLGYSINADDAPQRNLEVTLFLFARQRLSTDYTFSVKARDARERVWGQEDKWTGNNSYATTQWSPGDLIVERFYPGLSACAPADEYRVTVEVYDPKTMQTLGDAVALGAWRADVSRGNLLEHLEPEHATDIRMGEDLHLIGYTLTPSRARAGETFSLALFWRGAGDGSLTRRVAIRLGDTTLAEQSIALPIEARGLCTLFDLQATRAVTPGIRALSVNDIKITDFTLDP